MKIKDLKHYKLFKSPGPLSIEDWNDWNCENKSNHPIKWFFYDTVPNFFNINVLWPIRRIVIDKWYWGFVYRFIPKHQYHIIKPSTLSPKYHNQYDLILHSSFHILVEFIEFEKKHGNIDWQASDYYSDFWDEANRLVYWWKHIRPNREDWLMRYYPYPEPPKDHTNEVMWMFYTKYEGTEEHKEWINISNIHKKYEDQFEKDDELYLIRLAKIRMFLWN